MAVKISSTTESQEDMDLAARPDWRENGYRIVSTGEPEEPAAGESQAVAYTNPRMAMVAAQERLNQMHRQAAEYDAERAKIGDHEYWRDLTAQAGSILIPNAVLDQVRTMKGGAGAKVAEYLAENPEQAKMLAKLSPAMAKATVERVREKVTHDLGSMGMREYIAARQRQIAEKTERLKMARGRGWRR